MSAFAYVSIGFAMTTGVLVLLVVGRVVRHFRRVSDLEIALALARNSVKELVSGRDFEKCRVEMTERSLHDVRIERQELLKAVADLKASLEASIRDAEELATENKAIEARLNRGELQHLEGGLRVRLRAPGAARERGGVRELPPALLEELHQGRNLAAKITGGLLSTYAHFLPPHSFLPAFPTHSPQPPAEFKPGEKF